MSDFINTILDKHGGTDLWKSFNQLKATIVSSGRLFDEKGFPQDRSPRTMTVHLHEQYASLHPFGTPDLRTNFRPNRVAVETLDGKVVWERNGNPEVIHQHLLREQWDPLDRAYFNGYALWTYLTSPFFLLIPGITTRETEPWKEGNEIWRVLEVKFPQTLATHSSTQFFYFGEDLLLKRHDYSIDIAGNFEAAQYMYDPIEVQGFMLPSKRRVYKKGPGGNPLLNDLMVSIDIQQVIFS
ncbi:hypothetical protein [Flavihumibacter solisilvae]|nr:hypothetical protein [Flavihumibacter solisilvae]